MQRGIQVLFARCCYLNYSAKRCAVHRSQIDIYICSQLHHLRHFQTVALFGFQRKEKIPIKKQHDSPWHLEIRSWPFLEVSKHKYVCVYNESTPKVLNTWAVGKTLMMNLFNYHISHGMCSTWPMLMKQPVSTRVERHCLFFCGFHVIKACLSHSDRQFFILNGGW